MAEPQHRRVVLGITGRIGAGKTSAGKYLASERGFQYLRYSQVLSEWRGAEANSKAELQAVGWAVMAGSLQPGLNRELIARIQPGKDCAVDGLRHPVDYESLRNTFASSFFLIFVDCPAELRWQRLQGNSRYKSRQDFDSADAHPVEQHIDELRPRASAIIENTGSLGDLFVAVNGVLERIRSGAQS